MEVGWYNKIRLLDGDDKIVLLCEVTKMDKPKYLKWIVEEAGVIENFNKTLKCFNIDYNNDAEVLDDWALHIRRHYISDQELEEECDLLGVSPEAYLRANIIPQKDEGLGPTARSNTISEILFSDLLEFIFEYHVPRCRQYNMSGKTVSEHGTDIVGYKFAKEDKRPSKEDRLIAAEVKAILSKNDASVINKAVEDSIKDEYRISLTLNYMRRKLRDMGKIDESNDILRFQFKTKAGHDYTIDYIAAGITSMPTLQKIKKGDKEVGIITGIDGASLAISDYRSIFFVHGKKLMELAHEVYERCKK